MAYNSDLLNFFGAMLRPYFSGRYESMLAEFKNERGDCCATWWDIYGVTEEDVMEYVLDDDEHKVFEALDRNVERTAYVLDSGKWKIYETTDMEKVGQYLFDDVGNSVDDYYEKFIDFKGIAKHFEERGNIIVLGDNDETLYVWDEV